MSSDPWLSIIGLGEDGPEGLTPASRAALEAAEVIMGPPRHLSLVPETGAERIAWPVPFADGIDVLKGFEGRRVAVLASGDPFWFGSGSIIARTFPRDAWRAYPGQSCFALMASLLGIALDSANIVALHAAPMQTLRPALSAVAPALVTLRDGASVAQLGDYLTDIGAGDSVIFTFEHLGGPDERVRQLKAAQITGDFDHPVCAAIYPRPELKSKAFLQRSSGLPDSYFDHDGQITKQSMRAITLSSLAPSDGALLFDLGGGSGSISIEWCLAAQGARAICVERDPTRVARICANADALGVGPRVEVVEGDIETLPPAVAAQCRKAQAVFIGGGLSETVIERVIEACNGQWLVANAVTLEAEALLSAWHARIGGKLTRIEIAEATPLGSKRGWKASYPVVQWRVFL